MKKLHILFVGFLILGIQSCSEFLDSKPNRNLVIPESLDDFQQMLDAERTATAKKRIERLKRQTITDSLIEAHAFDFPRS